MVSLRPVLKYLQITVLAHLLLSIIFPIASTTEYPKTAIDTLAFKQEILIPFDTSNETAKYQPIDLTIQCENPCWGINETIHSVRVGFDDGSGLQEIESQVYDIETSDDSHFKACSIVFLIPEVARQGRKNIIYCMIRKKQTNELLEAMQCGVAVAAFDCPSGPGEIVRHEDTGLLVPPGDVDALAAAIARLAADANLRQRLGTAAAADVASRFNLEHITDLWEEAWEAALKGNMATR